MITHTNDTELPLQVTFLCHSNFSSKVEIHQTSFVKFGLYFLLMYKILKKCYTFREKLFLRIK